LQLIIIDSTTYLNDEKVLKYIEKLNVKNSKYRIYLFSKSRYFYNKLIKYTDCDVFFEVSKTPQESMSLIIDLLYEKYKYFKSIKIFEKNHILKKKLLIEIDNEDIVKKLVIHKKREKKTIFQNIKVYYDLENISSKQCLYRFSNFLIANNIELKKVFISTHDKETFYDRIEILLKMCQEEYKFKLAKPIKDGADIEIIEEVLLDIKNSNDNKNFYYSIFTNDNNLILSFIETCVKYKKNYKIFVSKEYPKVIRSLHEENNTIIIK